MSVIPEDTPSFNPDAVASAYLDNTSLPTKGRYDDLIENSATRHSVDPDLIRAITHQESTFNPRATSNKGAAGLMQLMPETARSLGVTNIYDPAQNIEGGTKYIKQQLDKFGSVPLALAAYNAGPGRVRNGQVPNIPETQDYVKKITGRYNGSGYGIDSNAVADSYLNNSFDPHSIANQYLEDNKGGQPVTTTTASPQTVQTSTPESVANPNPQRTMLTPEMVAAQNTQGGQTVASPQAVQAPVLTPDVPVQPSALDGIDPSQLFNGNARVAPPATPQTPVQPVSAQPVAQQPVAPTQTVQTPQGHVSDAVISDIPEERPQQAITPQMADNAVASTIALPANLKTQGETEDYLKKQLQAQYGGDFKDFGITGDFQPRGSVDVTYGALKNAGVDTNSLIRQKQIENRVENPQPDLRVGKDWAKADAEELTNTFGGPAAGAITTALNAGGNTAKSVAGLLRIIGDLNPAKGDSLAEATGLRPYRAGEDVVSYLKDVSDTTSRLAAASGNKVLGTDAQGNPAMVDAGITSLDLTKVGKAIGGLADLPRIMAIPGGPIISFATDSALQAAAEGNKIDWSNVEKQGAKGAALGAVSLVAPGVGKFGDEILGTLLNRASSNLLKEGITLGTIGAGTYATSRAFGDTHDQAIDNAIMFAGFHAAHLMGEQMQNIPIRVKDTNGNEAVISIDSDGTVKTLDPKTEAKAQIVIPPVEEQTAEQPADSVSPNAKSEPQSDLSITGETQPAPDKVGESIATNLPAEAHTVPVSEKLAEDAIKQYEGAKEPLPELTDNYLRDLSTLTPTLYRETSPAKALELLSGDSKDDTPYFANTPNLAKGQGVNKGILIELDSKGLQGQVNTSKPGWELAYKNGEAEFVGKYNKSYRDNVKSITIAKESLPKAERLYRGLDADSSGFSKATNPDGSVTFTKNEKSNSTDTRTNIESTAPAESAKGGGSDKIDGQTPASSDTTEANPVDRQPIERKSTTTGSDSTPKPSDTVSDEVAKPTVAQTDAAIRQESEAKPDGTGEVPGERTDKSGIEEKVNSKIPIERKGEPSSIMNREVNTARENRGWEKLSTNPEWRIRNEDLHEKVKGIIKDNPSAPLETYEKFRHNPDQAPTKTENVLLNAHYLNEKADWQDMVNRYTKAMDSDDPLKMADAKMERKIADAKLDSAEKVLRRAGTESGQALQSRQMFADEDFEFVNLAKEYKMAKGEAPSSGELKRLQDIADEHKAKSDELRAILAGKDEELAAMKAQMPPRHILDVAENYVNKLHSLADRERERLKTKGNVFQAGIDPRDLKSAAIIGADHLATMGLDFAKWSDKMVDEFGDKVRPHLEKLFDEAQKVLKGGHAELRSDADKVASVLKGQKTRMENRINELENAIKTRERITRNRISVTPDAELTKLRDRVKSLKDDYDAIFPKEPRGPMTDTQRLQALEKRLEKKQKTISDKIENQDLSEKEKRIALDPMTVKQDTSGKYSADDRERAGRIIAAQAEIGRIEKRYARMKTEAERANEPLTKWGFRKATNFVRGSMLSAVSVIEKLGAASIGRTVTSPIKTAIGTGVSKLVPGIADKAAIEGSKGIVNDFRNEANATAKAYTTGISDIGRTIIGKGTDISNAYGKTERYLTKGRYLPVEASQLVGLMHESLKAPAFRNEFERVLANLVMHEKINDRPVDNQTMFVLGQRAYDYAQRIKFQENNVVSSKIREVMTKLDNHELTPVQALGASLHILLPIEKISTNVVKQSFESSPFGLGKGIAKAASAYSNGLENLSPEQADIIMRNLKHGALGTAMYALGLFGGGKVIGSFYQKYDKDGDKSKAKYNTVQIGDTRIPAALLHLPEFNSMFMGATVKRIYEESLAAKDKTGANKYGPAQSAFKGIGGGARGLIEEVPGVEAGANLVNIYHAIMGGDEEQMNESRYGLGNFVAGRTVPGIVRNASEWFDQDPQGHFTTPFTREPYNRKIDTKTFGSSLQTQIQKSIPGWRNELPNNTPTAVSQPPRPSIRTRR